MRGPRGRTPITSYFCRVANREVTGDTRVHDMSRLSWWSASQIGGGAVPHWPRFPGSGPPEGQLLHQANDPERRQEDDPVVVVASMLVGKQPGESVSRGSGQRQSPVSKPGDKGHGATERNDDRDATHSGLLPDGRSALSRSGKRRYPLRPGAPGPTSRRGRLRCTAAPDA